MKINLLLLCVTVALFGCRFHKSAITDGIINIDLSKSYPRKEVQLQSIADIEYVPLETTNEVLLSPTSNSVSK